MLPYKIADLVLFSRFDKLQAKTLGVAPGEGEAADSVTSFLLKAMDPPHMLSIKNAINLLQVSPLIDVNLPAFLLTPPAPVTIFAFALPLHNQ